jgi:hypothetical protein
VSDGVNYDVNAFLRTQGSFDQELTRAARSADTLGSSWSRMSQGMISAGERVRGTFGGMASEFARGGAMAIGGGMVAGIGAATVAGVKYNDVMEQGALGLATMYQTFGVAEGLERNVELAKAFQHELVAIADASPGTTEDMMVAYQTAAPAMSSVTQDLMRQKAVMSQLATMAWTNTEGSYKTMGSDFGRIIQGAAGAETAMFKTLAEPIKEAFEEITGQTAKSGEAWSQQFNKAVQEGGDVGLRVMEKVLANVPPEFAAAFGSSFGGVLASVQSKMTKLAGDFGKPLFDSMRESMVKLGGTGGPFSEESFGKLREIAFFSGGLLADAFERGAEALIRGIDYVANNWQRIAEMIRDAGVVAGVAIKSAIIVGMTRHFVGSAMIVAGKMAEVISAAKSGGGVAAGWVGGQIKQTHMGLARGMKGGGSGMLGGMGRGMGSAFGKADGSKGSANIFRGMDVGLLKVASLVTSLGSLGVVAAMAGTALGAIGVVVGGMAAYFTEHWDRISGSIVQGLQDGTITLVPLMTSLYTFYARLVMVGQALMGGSDAVGTVNSGLNFLTSTVDMVSGALSWFIWGLSIMVGGWASLKLGMLGVMAVIMQIVSLANTLGAVSDSALANAQGNYDKFSDSVDATFHKADMLAAASEKIGNAQLTPLDYAKAETKAKELEKSLMDALSGTSKKPGEEGKGRAKKPSVKIDKVVVEVKLDDPDPDRVFSSFLPKMVALADKRIQPYETMEVGE